MTRAEPPEPTTSPLTAARRASAQQKRQDADAAIRRLVRRKAPVTFRAVAAEAGVSAGYLHRHPDLAPRIRQLRTNSGSGRQLHVAQETDHSIEAALREHIRRLEARHQEQLHNLRQENASLRTELEAALGEVLALRRVRST